MQNPDQLDRLRSDPTLMVTAVDEILRWSSPVTYFRRTASRDVEMSDQMIRAGDTVTFWHASANRDEEVFKDPFIFDIARTPNDHVAFGGGGPHYCLGATLAKREIRVMFEALLDRFGTWRATGDPVWAVPGVLVTVVCSLDRLPMEFS